MATAKKLPSGNFRIRVYDKRTGKYKSFTAETKKEAERLASEYLNNAKPIATSDLTVDRAIQLYIDSKDNVLSPSTIRGYYAVKNNSIDEIKDIKIIKINELTLQKWTNNNAKHYSWKSIRNQFALVISALKQNKINLDIDQILLKPKQKREIEIPSFEDMSKILHFVEDTNIEIQATLALMLGLRQSEIHALQWSDYDGHSIKINKAKVVNKDGKYVIKNINKSYAGNRTVQVDGLLKERLNKYNKKNNEQITTLCPTSTLRIFTRLCNKNKIKPYTMHSLRHGNASLMLQQGVPDKYAIERLGQSTTNILRTVYQHTFKDTQKEISNKVSNAFEDIYAIKHDAITN